MKKNLIIGIICYVITGVLTILFLATSVSVKLIIPSSYITIISSLKLNISLTLIGVITGEFLSCQKGIGYLIMYGSQIFDLDLVISGVFILLIFSYLLYFIISKIEKRLIRED